MGVPAFVDSAWVSADRVVCMSIHTLNYKPAPFGGAQFGSEQVEHRFPEKYTLSELSSSLVHY